MPKPKRSSICTVCKASAGPREPRFSQAGDRAVFCSFECMIDFALGRIRARRVHHNEQMDEMRKHFAKPGSIEQRCKLADFHFALVSVEREAAASDGALPGDIVRTNGALHGRCLWHAFFESPASRPLVA